MYIGDKNVAHTKCIILYLSSYFLFKCLWVDHFRKCLWILSYYGNRRTSNTSWEYLANSALLC